MTKLDYGISEYLRKEDFFEDDRILLRQDPEDPTRSIAHRTDWDWDEPMAPVLIGTFSPPYAYEASHIDVLLQTVMEDYCNDFRTPLPDGFVFVGGGEDTVIIIHEASGQCCIRGPAAYPTRDDDEFFQCWRTPVVWPRNFSLDDLDEGKASGDFAYLTWSGSDHLVLGPTGGLACYDWLGRFKFALL